jgi:hypothetical protein
MKLHWSIHLLTILSYNPKACTGHFISVRTQGVLFFINLKGKYLQNTQSQRTLFLFNKHTEGTKT